MNTIRRILHTASAAFFLAGILLSFSCSVSYLEDRLVEMSVPEAPQERYTIEIDTSPGGRVRIEPEGKDYEKGALIKIVATADEGFRFEGFSGTVDNASNRLVLTVEKDEWLIPEFVPLEAPKGIETFRIRVDTAAGGGVKTEPEPFAVEKGTLVSITAIPAVGFVFTGWKGTKESKDNPFIFEADKNEWIHPVFAAVEPIPEPELFTINLSRMTGGDCAIAPASAAGYRAKTLVSLHGISRSGYRFEKWTGTIESSANPLVFAVDGDEWVIPVFVKEDAERTYTVRIDDSSGGSISLEGQKEAYISGDSLKLTAQPASGWRFISWGGTIAETEALARSNPLILKVAGDEWIFPIFEPIPVDPEPEIIPDPQYSINLDAGDHGSASAQPAKESYLAGEFVRLSATPEAGYEFAGWTGTIEATANPCVLTVDGDEWIMPVFRQQASPIAYTLRLDGASSGAGAGTEGGTAVADGAKPAYSAGDTVKLRATPAAGWRFVSWAGTVSTTANPFILEINKNEWVYPVFEPIPVDPEPEIIPDPQYSINLDAGDHGSVSAQPSKASYLAGEFVRLSATPEAGYEFAGWTGTIEATANPCVLTVDSDEWIMPVFRQQASPIAYTLRLDGASSGAGSGAGTGAEGGTAVADGAKPAYSAGDTVKLRATPAAGWRFVSWGGTVSTTANPFILEINKNEWVYPVFEPIPVEPEPDPKPAYTILVDEVDHGSALFEPSKTSYSEGELVRVYGKATNTYEFAFWTGTINSTENPLLIRAERNEWLIPVFRKKSDGNTLSLRLDTAEGGTAVADGAKPAYTPGDTVKLRASPSPGWKFVSWGGTISVAENPFILEINKNEWIYPVFELIPVDPEPEPEIVSAYTINLDSAAHGNAVRTPVKPSYTAGEFVRISAEPDPGYEFESWSGSISSAQNPLILRVAASEWIIPVFAKIPDAVEPEPDPIIEYTVRADSTPFGTSSVDPGKSVFTEGEYVKITATPAPGYVFSGWHGTLESMQNPLVLRVEDHAWVIPSFSKEPRYALVAERNITGGSVTVSPDKAGEYEYGEFCTLTATADPGYAFEGWYGDASGKQQVLTVCMTRDLAVHPQFSLIPVEPQFTVNAGSSISGTVRVTPDKEAYGLNETVYLTAAASDGYLFRSWGGDASGDRRDTTITVTKDMTVEAEFVPAVWTHLVYMAADNSLDSQALNDLNEMEASVKLADTGMTVLALIDRKYGNGDWSDTRLYEIRNTPGVNSAIVESIRLDCAELGLSATTPGELNMADPVTLERFISFALSSRKAAHYSLTIWGHGTGWRGIDGGGSTEENADLRAVAVDDTSGSYMDTATLSSAIQAGLASGSGLSSMDVIGFDTCFGALLETAYPLRNVCRFLLGSEGPTKETGWNYTELLNTMAASGLSPADWCNAVVDRFAASYASTENATISAIDMSKVGALQQQFNEWARSVAAEVAAMPEESDRTTAKNKLRNLILNDIDSFCYPAMQSDFYADVASLAQTIEASAGFGDSTAVVASCGNAVTRTWSAEYGYAHKQIGVFVNVISAFRIFDTAHSAEYTAGSGAVVNPFVTDTDGWVPAADRGKISFLNMLFY